MQHTATNLPSADLPAMAGQLLMAGFQGLTPSPEIAALIRESRIGGVILFRRNIESAEQVQKLCAELQAINAEVSNLPLLIGIDQEGGMVMRLEEGVTPLPSAMAYAHGGSAVDCREMHRLAAAELAALGININFAPVLDINNNPANPVIGVRALGEDVDTVIEYGLAAIDGIHAAGIAATAKHFPGHGDTATDSHYALPLVPHERARLDAIELAPFRAAIAAGVDAIMTAHVVFPAIEPDTRIPATLSHKVLTGLLREELGFGGLIFTDCLEMDAIAGTIGTVPGAVEAIRAGADIALVSHTPEKQRAAIAELGKVISGGYIHADIINSSLQRITKIKVQIKAALRAAQPLRTPAALALSARIQQQAMQADGLPLDRQQAVLLITFELMRRTEIDEVALGASRSARGSLLPLLQAAGMLVEEIILPPDAADAEIAAALVAATNRNQVIVQSYNATRWPQQQKLVAAIDPARLWLVAGRNPYDLALAPAARARLAAFGNRPAALLPVAAWLLR